MTQDQTNSLIEHGARRYIITVTVVLCTLLELIDTTVVNVATNTLMGNLGATLSEVSWVIACLCNCQCNCCSDEWFSYLLSVWSKILFRRLCCHFYFCFTHVRFVRFHLDISISGDLCKALVVALCLLLHKLF
jgi:hypothetical protein